MTRGVFITDYKYVNEAICRGQQRLAKFNEHGINFFVEKDFYYDGDFVIYEKTGIELDLTQMVYLEDAKWGPCYINDSFVLVVGDHLGMSVSLYSLKKIYCDYHGYSMF
jgi:hypothetical protein